LISARLDTLPAERKSLLQDASVLGKVFWAGAVAAMAGRDRHEVELALHELTRKELVRPARMSSMEGEHEYGFWHVLVRDVCYGQIPRAARAARHLAAAGWIEEKARERAEDLADVLAYHYQSALELNQAAGVGEQTEQLQAQVVRYLALAGERALSLDIEQAERQLARALDLCPDNAPERASLLERWAQAAQQQGRLQDARQAFQRALDLYREQGEPVAAGRVLTRLALVVHRLGDPGSEQLLAEARDLLEEQPPGPELVSTYAYTAGRHTFANQYSDTIESAERALTLASELDLPEPAFALHWRGVARCALGEGGGLEDVHQALQLALEQNLGREAAVIYGNLGGAVWSYRGPRAALDVFGEAIAFCERRGIAEMVLQTRSAIPTALADLGHTEQALAEAGPLADRIEAGGDMSYVEPRALLLRLLAERGAPEQAPTPDALVAAVRGIGLPAFIAIAFAAVAQLLLAQGNREQARALLQELDELAASTATFDEGSLLPSLVRVALALDEGPLAERLAAAVQPVTPSREHELAAVRAQLAEAAGDHVEAASMYTDAADRWRTFGNVPERAYALLGQGRCLVALGDWAAESPLAEARDLFASMGYKPALAETETLLAETVAKTA
jgi:tetratricopeptide (TPR) repeat protein